MTREEIEFEIERLGEEIEFEIERLGDEIADLNNQIEEYQQMLDNLESEDEE